MRLITLLATHAAWVRFFIPVTASILAIMARSAAARAIATIASATKVSIRVKPQLRLRIVSMLQPDSPHGIHFQHDAGLPSSQNQRKRLHHAIRREHNALTQRAA